LGHVAKVLNVDQPLSSASKNPKKGPFNTPFRRLTKTSS
jgi:hypothetical protein